MALAAERARDFRQPGALMQRWLVDRNEDRASHLTGHGLREVALAGGVFHEDHLAGADNSLLAVAGRELHARVEVDDVLPARRRMPIKVVVAGRLAKDDARGRKTPR